MKTRVSIVAALGPRITNPKKADKVVALFRFSDEKKQVEDILKSRAQTLQSQRFSNSHNSPLLASGRGAAASGVNGGRGGRGGRGSFSAGNSPIPSLSPVPPPTTIAADIRDSSLSSDKKTHGSSATPLSPTSPGGADMDTLYGTRPPNYTTNTV